MPDIFISNKKNKIIKDDKEGMFVKGGLVKPGSGVNRHTLPGHSHSPIASFCYYPDHVHFVNKDPQEKVVLLLRCHPITNLKWMVLSIIMFVLPPAVSGFTFFESIPLRYLFVSTIIWYLLTFAYVFEKFLGWFFHVNIITDERIIEVDFVHLLYREITDANIDHIEDVTVEMSGAVRTYFNFGNIYIQTAAEVPRIDFEAIPQPDKVARVLRELRIEEEQEKLEGRVR